MEVVMFNSISGLKIATAVEAIIEEALSCQATCKGPFKTESHFPKAADQLLRNWGNDHRLVLHNV